MANLIAWWECQGNADDSIGELDGVSTADLVDGRFGEANGAYDLETGVIQCASSSLLDIEDHTICFWFKLTGFVAGWKNFFDWGVTGRSPNIWRHTTDRRFHWRYNPDNTGFNSLGITGDGGTEFSDGIWYWACVAKKGAVATAFVNGVDVGTAVITIPKEAGAYALSFGDSAVKLHITDIRIYDDALSLKEARAVYHDEYGHWRLNDSGIDSSGREHNGVVDGGAFSADRKIGSHSWQKTADANEITTTCYPNSQNTTYACWFKTTGTGGTLAEAVMGHRNGGSGFMFYRNDGNGDTQFHTLKYYTTTVPAGAGILISNYFTPDTWHHIVMAYDENGNYKLFINGVKDTESVAGSFDFWDDSVVPFYIGYGGDGWTQFRGYIDDVRIFMNYLSDADCIALFEERASLDNQGNLHGVEFLETKYRELLLNHTDWEDGQTGSVGDFSRNGDVAENERNNGLDPFGNTIPLWECIPDVDNDADGGWNHAYITADKTKTYRYSVWVKRTGTSAGTTYIGCMANDVKRVDTGVVDGNPYFWATDPPNYTDWFLWVGHIRPYDMVGTAIHPDDGIWDLNGVKVNSAIRYNGYKWIDDAVIHRHRAYLFYCIIITNRQYMCYPRVDLCDGTEPTIQDLIAGIDGFFYDYVFALDGAPSQALSITPEQVLISNISEVGVVDGLVAWFPLNANANNFVTTNHGTVTDATIVEGNKDMAYNFAGVSHKIEVPDNVDLEPDINISVHFWFKMDSWTGARQILCVKWLGYSCEIGADQKMYFRVNNADDGTINSPTTTSIVSTGVWHHFVGTYNTSAGVGMYFDNVDYGLTPATGALNYDGNVLKIGRYSDALRLLGDMRDVRIYDKVLSVEEVGALYNVSGGGNNFITKNLNILYTREKIIEI